jgi:hypothetical protein
MLPTQRRQAILTKVSERSAVAADELAREVDVSVETIRRDLRDLQRRGLLDRVYGGATRPVGRSSEGSFAARSSRHIEAKRAIAALAASLVEPGETIVIDVGTTALEVARALPPGWPGCSAPARASCPPWPGRRSPRPTPACGPPPSTGTTGSGWTSSCGTRAPAGSGPPACPPRWASPNTSWSSSARPGSS